MKPLMQQMHQLDEQLQPYVEGTYDDAKVQALVTQQAQTLVQFKVEETRIHNELYQLLTPDQQAKLKEIRGRSQARMQQRRSSKMLRHLSRNNKSQTTEHLGSVTRAQHRARFRQISAARSLRVHVFSCGMLPWTYGSDHSYSIAGWIFFAAWGTALAALAFSPSAAIFWRMAHLPNAQSSRRQPSAVGPTAVSSIQLVLRSHQIPLSSSPGLAPSLLKFHLQNLHDSQEHKLPLLPYLKRYRWGLLWGAFCVVFEQ